MYSSYELKHHGIMGQRWGKKNGPPYPLDASDHSASERKANWRLSLKKSDSNKKENPSSNNTKNQNEGLTDKQKETLKKVAKIGVAAAITSLAVIGVKRSGLISSSGLTQKGKDIVFNAGKNIGKEAYNIGNKFKGGVPKGFEDFGDKLGKAVGFTIGVLAIKELSDITGTTDKVKQVERTYNSNHKKDNKLNITNLNVGFNVDRDDDDDERHKR